MNILLRYMSRFNIIIKIFSFSAIFILGTRYHQLKMQDHV